MKEKNQKMINEFARIRNLQDTTKNKYKICLNKYSIFYGLTLNQLLDEADEDEEKGVRWKSRRLKEKLINYRNYVYDNYLKKTADSYFNAVITFYKTYDIEIHNISRIGYNNVKENPPLNYEDMLDDEIIKKAIDKSNSLMTALILFMCSSGSAKAETLSLTINDFINATNNNVSNYHNSNDIYEVMDILKDKNEVVPMFRLKRKKTNKYYYTFCSAEATHYILVYLSNRGKQLKGDDKLFKIHPVTLTNKFIELNNDLGLGKAGTFNRLRTHMFRKFHATCLMNDGMSIEEINCLQGKRRNIVDEVYFFDNPNVLKEKYIKHMGAVTIKWDVRSLDVKSEEFKVMEEEYRKYDEFKDRFDKVEQFIYDNFDREDLNRLDDYFK